MNSQTGALPDFAITPPPPVLLPIQDDDAVFPVGRLFCVGRNYAAHAAEMGHDSSKEPPLFFMKPASAVLPEGQAFQSPARSADVHHEIELVVAIGVGGADIAPAQALSHVFGYAVGLDMTLRDIQAEAKSKGRPWEAAKAFDGSAPIALIRKAADIGHPASGAVTLTVNGDLRQSGDLDQQIWSVPDMIAHLSRQFTLQPGDLIMTGTPSGVAAVQKGDVMDGAIAGVGTLRVTVAP